MAECATTGKAEDLSHQTDASEHVFDVEKYCRQYCSLDMTTADPFEVHSLKSRMKIMYDYYQMTGLKDARVIEYGSGPSVYSLISAVPYCQEIVISEYDVRSRDLIMKWKNGESNHHFTTLFQYVVTSIEQLNDADVPRRENALRQLISGIYPGDLSNDTPIEMESPGLFDIISTHFTTHHACASVDEITAAVGRLAKYLKPAGFLILSEILDCKLGGNWDGQMSSTTGFQLTRESFIDCIKKLGFIIVDDRVVTLEPIDGKEPPEFGKTITLLAQAPRV